MGTTDAMDAMDEANKIDRDGREDAASGAAGSSAPECDQSPGAVRAGARRQKQGKRPEHALATERAVPPGAPPADEAATELRSAPLAVRQERALALLCQGQRPPAIAALLGTTPGTVRRWLRGRFAAIQREAREEHATALLRAIEAQREIARAAWEAFQHERSVEGAVLRGELDRVKRRAVRRTGAQGRGRAVEVAADRDRGAGAESEGEPGPAEDLLIEEIERPRLPAQGARYLALAQSAEREMARLQGLYDELAEPPGQISITITRRPEGPENVPPEGHGTDESPGAADDEGEARL